MTLALAVLVKPTARDRAGVARRRATVVLLMIPRVGHLLHDPARIEPEVKDIDLRRFHTERRERCADLTAMVSAVLRTPASLNPRGAHPLHPSV